MTLNVRLLAATCLLTLALAACSAPTPTPLPIPTRMQPEDASQRGLAEALTELEYDLTQAQSLLAFMAKAPAVQSGSAEECSAYVRQLLQQNPRYTQLGAANANGELYCDTQDHSRVFDISDRLYYTRAASDREFSVGEYVIGRVTLVPSLGLASPIIDDSNSVRGIVLAPLRLGWLAERISEISIPVTGEIVIIDTYGNVVLRDPDATDWLGKNISNTPLGAAMLSKLNGSGDYAGADGETRYYTFGTPQSSHNHLIVAVGIKK